MEMSEQPLLVSVYSRDSTEKLHHQAGGRTFNCHLNVITQELDK